MGEHLDDGVFEAMEESVQISAFSVQLDDGVGDQLARPMPSDIAPALYLDDGYLSRGEHIGLGTSLATHSDHWSVLKQQHNVRAAVESFLNQPLLHAVDLAVVRQTFEANEPGVHSWASRLSVTSSMGNRPSTRRMSSPFAVRRSTTAS